MRARTVARASRVVAPPLEASKLQSRVSRRNERCERDRVGPGQERERGPQLNYTFPRHRFLLKTSLVCENYPCAARELKTNHIITLSKVN